MRRLKFTFITDDRFDKNIYSKIVRMDKRLKKNVKRLSGKTWRIKNKKITLGNWTLLSI